MTPKVNSIPLHILGRMDFGSRCLDSIDIKRSGGVGEWFRPNISVSTLPVTSVVNSGVKFSKKKSKSTHQKSRRTPVRA
jgi:hypothetical protein